MKAKIGICTWIGLTLYNISSVNSKSAAPGREYESPETEQLAHIHRRGTELRHTKTVPTKETSIFQRAVSTALPAIALAATGAVAYKYLADQLPHEAKFRKNEATKFHLGNNFLAVPLPFTRNRIKNQVLLEFFDAETAPKSDGSRRIISVQYAGDYNTTDEKQSPEAIISEIHTHVKMEARRISQGDNPGWHDLPSISRSDKTLNLEDAVDKINDVTQGCDHGPSIRSLEKLVNQGVLRLRERWSKPRPIRKELTEQLEMKKKGSFYPGELANAHLEEYLDQQGPRPIPGFGYTDGSYMPVAEGFNSIKQQLDTFLNAAVVDRLVSLFPMEIQYSDHIHKWENQDWMEYGIIAVEKALQTSWKILDQVKTTRSSGEIVYPFDGKKLARIVFDAGIELVSINYETFLNMSKDVDHDEPRDQLKQFVLELTRKGVEVEIVKGILEKVIFDTAAAKERLETYLGKQNYKLNVRVYGTEAEKSQIESSLWMRGTEGRVKRLRLESLHTYKLFGLTPVVGKQPKKQLLFTDSLPEARRALGFGISVLHLPQSESEFDTKPQKDVETEITAAMKLRSALTGGFLALGDPDKDTDDNSEQESETRESAPYEENGEGRSFTVLRPEGSEEAPSQSYSSSWSPSASQEPMPYPGLTYPRRSDLNQHSSYSTRDDESDTEESYSYVGADGEEMESRSLTFSKKSSTSQNPGMPYQGSTDTRRSEPNERSVYSIRGNDEREIPYTGSAQLRGSSYPE